MTNAANMDSLMPEEARALEALTKMNKNMEWPAIKESLFVNHYLPILTYNLTHAPAEHLQVKTEDWVRNVSKNPYWSVNVVSDNNPNVILFVVPPLLRAGPILNTGTGKHSFYEIMAHADQINKVLPGKGNVHLVYAVEQLLEGKNDLSEDQPYGFDFPLEGEVVKVEEQSDKIEWGQVDEM